MISIVVPTYNCQNTISKTIDSIINQTYDDFELLLIDDESIDDTLKIIRSFNDSRIKIYSKKHSGVSASRNYGIKKANNNYLCFVDSDDYLQEDYLEKLYRFMIENDCDFVMCNYNKIIDNKIYEIPQVFNNNTVIEDKNTLINILFHGNNKYNLASNCMGLYRKDIIDNNKLFLNENIDYGEDIIFNYQYIHYIKRFGYINEALYNYVYNNDSLTDNVSSDKLNILFNTIKDNLKTYGDIENKYVKTYYLNQIIIYLTNNIFKLDKIDTIRYNSLDFPILKDISYNNLISIKDKMWLYLIKNNRLQLAYRLYKFKSIFKIY